MGFKGLIMLFVRPTRGHGGTYWVKTKTCVTLYRILDATTNIDTELKFLRILSLYYRILNVTAMFSHLRYDN